MNQSQLAVFLGVIPQDITNWKSRGLPTDKYALCAEKFNKSVDELLGNKVADNTKQQFDSNVKPFLSEMRAVPVISYVQAGALADISDPYPMGAGIDLIYTDIELSEKGFALEIEGESMLPEFSEGDRVIIDPEVAPSPGDFVVAKNGNDQATFKKYRPRTIDAHGNTVFELVPLNPDYPIIRSDEHNLIVIGVMVEHRKYRRKYGRH